MSKSVLIVGGSGLLGRRLTQQLQAFHPELEVIIMMMEKMKRSFLPFSSKIRWLSRRTSTVSSSVKNFEWDIEKGEVDKGALENLDHLVYLSGYPIAGGRLDEEHKRRCWTSRIEGVKLLGKNVFFGLFFPFLFL
jgi:NAD dependent epimerase/dehydratase family enzyme